MIAPDTKDKMKVRRTLALWICVYAFLVLPVGLVIAATVFDTSIELSKAVLTYIGLLAGGPIGAYLYAAHKNGNSEK